MNPESRDYKLEIPGSRYRAPGNDELNHEGYGVAMSASAHAGVPAFAGTTLGLLARSPRRKLLRQHQNLARARDAGPVAVEVGDQPLHVVAVHRALQRGLVGEFISRLIQRGVCKAPETPRFP